MAIGDLTIEELVKRVRMRTQQYGVRKAGLTDIEEALNEKQREIFTVMPESVRKEWYGVIPTSTKVSVADIVTGYRYIELPEECFEVTAVKQRWIADLKIYTRDCTRIEVESAEEKRLNSFSDQVGYFVYGRDKYGEPAKARLYLVSGENISTHEFLMYYIRHAIDMDSSNDMDLPPVYAPLLVAESAMTIIAGAEMDQQQKDGILQILAFQVNQMRKMLDIPVIEEQKEQERFEKIGAKLGGPASGQSREAYIV